MSTPTNTPVNKRDTDDLAERPRAFLILHGWQNHRPKDHWQHWLADRLGELGHQVTYPQLPDPDDPDLEAVSYTHLTLPTN